MYSGIDIDWIDEPNFEIIIPNRISLEISILITLLKNKIFNRYESTNKTISDSKSGTGLGLFVVKRLVELQKGKIYLDEKVLLGTSIVIEFEQGETYD